LIARKSWVRDSTHLGQGELDAPDLTLVAETVLAGELEKGSAELHHSSELPSTIQNHDHLDRSPRQTASTACLVQHPHRLPLSSF
jgi:siderophore synthetase component